MLSELAATIHNKINEAIAVMTAQKPSTIDLKNGKAWLPRFEGDKPKKADNTMDVFKRQAAAIFGNK